MPDILVLYNAKVYTMDSQQPTGTAVALSRPAENDPHNGRILAVGDNNLILAEFDGASEKMDLNNQVILPGLTDAHIHLEKYALALLKVDCETSTQQECLQRIEERARQAAPGEWIEGHGWNQNEWPEGYGTLEDLDSVSPHNPVYLTAKSLHAAWANTAAFRAAGVTSQTPDPKDGRIGRNDLGNPDGILFEEAMHLVSSAIPKPSIDDMAQVIRRALPFLWKIGLTGVHDFDRRRCFAALQSLNAKQDLQLRVVKSIPVEMLSHAVELGLRTGFGDNFLRIGSIKAFADGALGPRTAAMIDPYEGEPDNRGIAMLDSEEIFEYGRLATTHGLSMAVHAIGDLANHHVLNAFAQVRQYEEKSGLPALRHRIEHVQVLHPDDLPRLAKLAVIASMQPIHATSDMYAAERYWGDRVVAAYAWRTLLEDNTPMAFGSDAPVESPNPFWGLNAAITRQREDGRPDSQGWIPEQRITLKQALKAYTTGAAYAGGVEDRLGRLAPGTLADLIVLDKDPFEIEPPALRSLLPRATMLGGEWVYRKQ